MKPFQAVILVSFVALALIAVFIFASFSGRGTASIGTVAIWGTLPQDEVQGVITAVRLTNNSFDKVSYQEFPAAGFTDTLVQAIAAGTGPDLVIFPSTQILSDSDKILPISYNTVSRRSFQDSFVQAGESFLTPSGIIGLPFLIDPVVMYWNRTLYAEAGVASPPQYWDEFPALAPLLTHATDAGTLTQSAVALGEWTNVTHAKDIFVSLITGLGNPVVSRADDGTISVTLAVKGDAAVPPAESALSFYTGFSDPSKPLYSWSRSQPNDRDAFLAGTWRRISVAHPRRRPCAPPTRT